MNNYLTNLSLISDVRDFSTITYASNLGYFDGKLTNEAPLKYEIINLAKKGEVFDYYLIFASEEVLNLPRKNAMNLTTIEYFKNCIVEYLDSIKTSYPIIEKTLSEYINTKDYVEKSLRILKISDNQNSKQEWGRIIDFLQETFNPNTQNNYYMDFTGGSRVTSLVTTLLPHLLELYGASVKQIIYADINKEKRIVDLTSYYTIINEYENAHKDDSDFTKISAFKNLGGSVSTETINNVQTLDIIKETEEQNLSNKNKKKNSDNLLTQSKNASNIEKAIINKSIKSVNDVYSRTPFDKLLKQKDADLIKNFRESIVDILIDQKVLIPTKKTNNFKKDVKNFLEASDSYYEKYDKKNNMISGVVYQLQQLFLKLNYTDEDPLIVFKNMFDLTKLKINPTFSVSASKFQTDSFLNYIDKNNIMFEDEDSYSYFDWYKKYHVLMNIYLSFGFPFACTGRSFTYKNVENHYLNEVKKLLNQLTDLKHKDNFSYKEKIKELTIIENIENEIPERINFSLWRTQNVNSDFEKVLIKRIQEVRPYRNAISHNLNRDIKKEKELAAKIKDWIHEYQKI